ncbi:MAG: hypothetical protein RLZZ77_1681 [Bacteroidota bacterium]|jgi:hypothetical protein
MFHQNHPALLERDGFLKLKKMRFCSTLLLCLVAATASTQTFNERYGGVVNPENSTVCRSACILNDTIYVFAAEKTTDGAPEGLESWKNGFYKVDLYGNLVSYQLHGGYPEWTYYGWADSMQPTDDGSLAAFSWYSNETLDTIFYARIQKFDTNGNELWEKFYGDSIHDHAFMQGKPTSDGGFICIGSAILIENFPKFYVVKTDSTGNEEWHKYLGFGDKYRSGIWVNELQNSSGFVVSGFEDDTEYDPAALVFVLDTLGNITDWEKYSNWGNYDSQSAEGILNCSSGGFIFGSERNVEETGTFEYTQIPQLVRIDNGLDTLWTCDLFSEPNPSASAQVIQETPEGDFVTVGTMIDLGSAGTGVGHISKVSATGELLWHRTYRYAEFGDNLLFDIDPMPNGGFLCTGWMNGIPFLGDSIPDQDAWLLAVDSMGCLVPGCDTLDIAVSEVNPIEFSVYPNPADQFINIAFSKHQSLGQAEIKLYDLQGRLIKSVVITHAQATYMLECVSLENGSYLLAIEGGGLRTSKKIIVEH